jgi:riboflavin kinase/FMN adenylyltransferase
MKIYDDSSGFIKNRKTVVTVGTFDGLHKGHIKIIETMKKISAEIDGTTLMVTFEPHPRSVVSEDFDLKLLTPADEKKKILEETGLENLVVLNFTKEFSRLTSEEFIRHYIVGKFGTSCMVVGHDHKFGRDRLGDESKLREVGKQYGFEVTAVPAETIEGEIISSTKIRNLLAEGNVEKAGLMLGRNYCISGIVVKGAQRGRLLGFPTANIKPENELKAVPKRGVYVVGCSCSGKKLFGIMNIGIRPTFENTNSQVIEVYLFNFEEEIYGERISVDFIKRLREEKKFDSKEELILQIEVDKMQALQLISLIN